MLPGHSVIVSPCYGLSEEISPLWGFESCRKEDYSENLLSELIPLAADADRAHAAPVAPLEMV